MKQLLIYLFLICNVIVYSQNIGVIPQPRQVILSEDKFRIADPGISIKLSLKDTSNIFIPINEFKEIFKLIRNTEINFNQDTSRTIWVGIPDDDEYFRKMCEELGILESNKQVGNQGYILLIKNNIVILSANTKAGIYYGFQTLKQLIKVNKDKSTLPGMKIIDYPSLEYRGILDDISRGPVPTFEYMKQQVRRLAELKMNTLQYYIENVVKTRSHPAFAPEVGSITIDELRELSEFAKKYHVMLIGNFQSFGHFEKILAHPDYSHLGEGGTLLSPAYPESIELLKDIYSEMVPAFGAPYFNVNSDETFDLGKGASKPMVDSLGIAVVYTDQIKKMYDILKDLGVRMMMWTDIILQHPESLEMLPKDIIMMTWGYDANDNFDNMILPVKDAGYEFTVSPGILNSYSTMPDYSVTMKNIRNLVRDGEKHGAMGMVLTVWDDGGSAFFSRDWYGVAYGAEHSWNPNNKEISDFDRRFNSAVYGDQTGNFTKAVWKLVELSSVPVTDRLQEKLLWTKVIPDPGESLRIGIDGWKNVSMIAEEAETYLKNASGQRYGEDYRFFKFTADQYIYSANLRYNLIDAAKFYSFAYEIQNEDGVKARESLLNAVDLIGKSRMEFSLLYNDYRTLWLIENKTHAVDIILDKYQDIINNLKDTEERIFLALKELDKGERIPQPAVVRLGVTEGEGKYFREWMMINPVPNPDGSRGNNIDYLKDMNGELNVVPKVTQEFDYGGNIYRWRRTESEYFDIVDVAEEFRDNYTNVATYAFANIDSPDDRIVEAALGSTDGVDVILNGKLVYQIRKNRPLTIDEDIFPLTLRKGRNNLMLKLFQGEGDWKFTFRLREYDVSNSKNRYKIVE
jgi:hexosaminidase